MSDGSIAVIYRWRIAEGAETAFRDRWSKATLELRALGGLGSMLSRNAAGDWVAIALWPSRETRTAAFADHPSRPPLAGVEFVGEEVLEVIEDLWLTSPYPSPLVGEGGPEGVG
jgi:hypothetical protein